MTGSGRDLPGRRRWPLAASVLLLLVGVSSLAQGPGDADAGNSGQRSANELIEFGETVYAERCAVCHGATGEGLAEAREAFPEDHRRCERCHRPGNPATMSLAEIEARQHDLFAIGDPPRLYGPDSLAANLDDAALRSYLKAAMPRYRPGTLADEEYRALTAFLIDLQQRKRP